MMALAQVSSVLTADRSPFSGSQGSGGASGMPITAVPPPLCILEEVQGALGSGPVLPVRLCSPLSLKEEDGERKCSATHQ